MNTTQQSTHDTHEAIVMVKTTHMPNEVRSPNYRKIALVIIDRTELPEGATQPRMISERARGVVEIMEEHDRIHIGRTAKSAGVQLLNELRAQAQAWNAAHGVEE